MNCNERIETNGTVDLFTQLGIDCTPDPTPWWAQDQPSYVSDPSDPNYGKCVGYIGVPGGVLCGTTYPTSQRLCHCDSPSTSDLVFGTGLSQGLLSMNETWMFAHIVPDGHIGVMNHFWITYDRSVDNGTIIRYYVDGETEASIQFTPSLACGTGSYDVQAPWGTKWFGKGAMDGGWYLNFRIPFTQSIVVTTQHLYANNGFYMIVRGGLDLPVRIGDFTLPDNAKLQLQVVQKTVQPIEWVPVADVPTGFAGLHFMHTLAIQSGDPNFLEGCYHMYTGNKNKFPGIVLSTGTEDYFDSAWYFNAGQFHFPVSGFTHLNMTTDSISWSAYRFHEMDPLRFDDSFKLVWRNGDLSDHSGVKCMVEGTDGTVVGSPTASLVTSYSWVYIWPAATHTAKPHHRL